MRLRNFQIKEVIIWKSRSTGKSGIYGGHVFWPVTPPVYLCGSGLRRCCGLYFLLRPHMGMETVSWVCMLGAAPFAAIGFIKYHGMTAEKFLWVWIKSEILMPKYLVFHPENLYYELTKDEIRKQEKEAMGKHVKNTKNRHAAGQGEV